MGVKWEKRKKGLQASGKREVAAAGGKARASALSPARRSAIAKKAALAMWANRRKLEGKADA